MLEAHRREKARVPVVDRAVGPDQEFICSLVNGDALSWVDENGSAGLYRVRALDKEDERIYFVASTDSRKLQEIKDDGGLVRKSADMLRKGQFQKVTITPLGEVRPVND